MELYPFLLYTIDKEEKREEDHAVHRKLFFLLALTLILSLMPISVWAASDNSVNRIPRVKEDYKFDSVSNAPVLSIKEKNRGEFGRTVQTFRLKLENAKWLKDADLKVSGSEGGFEKKMASLSTGVSVKRLTDTTVQVQVYDPDSSLNVKNIYRIPILVKVTGKGEARVIIDPRDSAVSGGTYVFAVAPGGDAIITVKDIVSFTEVGKIGDIKIEEKRPGALPSQQGCQIALRLPANFRWKNSGILSGMGGLAGTTATASVQDGTLTFTVDYSKAKDRSQLGSLLIQGLEIIALENAAFGDVRVNIMGDGITRSEGVIARYVEEKAPAGEREVIFMIGEQVYTVNGTEQWMDTAPYIKDGRTMLPIRYVAQALGIAEEDVLWNPADRTIVIYKENDVVSIAIGSSVLKVNDVPFYMDVPAEIKDGRTMLPIGIIGKAFGVQVDWDESSKTVTLRSVLEE